MNTAQVLPGWVQWAWALAGLGVALGGLCWILFIFWPYLKWSRGMMQQSFNLGAESAAHLKQLQTELSPVIAALQKTVADVRTAAADFQEKELKGIAANLEKIAASLTSDSPEDPEIAALVESRRRRRGIK